MMGFYKMHVTDKSNTKTIIAKLSDDSASEIIDILPGLNKENVNKGFTDIEANRWLYSQVEDLEELNLYTTSLDEVYEMLFDMGLTYNTIETRETLLDYVVDNIRNGYKVSPCLKSIEDNPDTDYFIFDCAGWSSTPAEPINSIEEMIEAVLN